LARLAEGFNPALKIGEVIYPSPLSAPKTWRIIQSMYAQSQVYQAVCFFYLATPGILAA
jgi:hypothetical protein